ncbi:minichromosome maintenance [Trifolium repens]|nr:minichromosome maintenance [Trifolium repens]
MQLHVGSRQHSQASKKRDPPFASQNVEVVDLGVRSDSLISSLKLDRQKDSKFAPLPGQLLRKYIADGATYYVIN